MRVLEEMLDLQGASPVDALGDLPAVLLYGLVLTFSHGAGAHAVAALREALAPVLGQPKQATLRFGQRVKPAKAADLLRALQDVPGVADVRLQARVRRFSKAGPGEVPLDGWPGRFPCPRARLFRAPAR